MYRLQLAKVEHLFAFRSESERAVDTGGILYLNEGQGGVMVE